MGALCPLATGATLVGMAWTRSLVLTAALVVPVLLPGDAFAENGIKPRLPVMWEPPVACLEFVDRSKDPVYGFSYNIADEDPSPGEALLADEVSDSRRHQFIALSRQGNPQTEYPHLWITPQDVQAAIQKSLISENTVPPDETMLTSPIWSEHFFRITPDDARRPIAWESVEAPVQWDTTGLQGGAYMLWGYTWEPAFNIWSQRSGNVVIVHDGDPDAVGPGVAITNGELIVYSDENATIEGCVHGAAGTTLRGEFAQTPGNGKPNDWQPSWIPFAQDVPVRGDTFALEFMPGEDYATKTLLVRVTATDPGGRAYEAHMPELINVLPGSDGSCEDGDGGGFIGAPGCGGDDSTGGGSGTETGDTPSTSGPAGSSGGSNNETSGTTGASSAQGTAEGGSGGTCTVDRRNSGFSLLVLALFGLRRRRRDAASRPQARGASDTAAVAVMRRDDRRLKDV